MSNLTLAKFLFLAVLRSPLTYWIYISMKKYKKIPKQNMEQMKESCMSLALLTMFLSDSLFK